MNPFSMKFLPKVIWFTGLSGAGKSTLAGSLADELGKLGIPLRVLDGDDLRRGLNSDLGFDLASREENLRRAAEVAKILRESGLMCLSCFITPTEKLREQVRNIIGRENIVEVFVNAPLVVCEDRDVKGLYRKARSGAIQEFTGISSPFEIPGSPDIVVRTDLDSVADCVEQCMAFIMPRITKA
jgi:adenylyl-sulfate kinase